MVERGGGTRGGGERTQSTNRMNGWMKSSLMTLFGLWLSSRSILGHGRLYTGAYSCQSQGRLNTIQ